jgi:hypothetical protein
MTGRFLTKYKKVREQRLGKNDARRIRAERDKARSPTSGAARRWPFELLQNAHDPGPRDSFGFVDVCFTAGDNSLDFQHNGRPFTTEDLAALLSGGSNKEYDATDTTGRFGTGFLVTHVLSPIIKLTGIVSDETYIEQFDIHLDRSGDESAILLNTKEAEASIDAAQAVDQLDDHWTADFRYPMVNQLALRTGIDALHHCAPFLFGTCGQLGSLVIEISNGADSLWEAGEGRWLDSGGVECRERGVTLNSSKQHQEYRILRFIPPESLDVGLLVLLQLKGESWEFVEPHSDLPKLFSRFPVRASTFLPINCVIDGQFEVQEERDRIAMSESDKSKLEAALQLIPKAVSIGLAEGWNQIHRLATLARVKSAFSEVDDPVELDWWNTRLSCVASDAARLPLVDIGVDGEFLPASSDEDDYADFILPRYSRTTAFDQLPEARAWEVASYTWVLEPPVESRSAEWNELTAGWEELGVPIERLGLREIGDRVRDGIARLDAVPAHEPRLWLARYFDLVGELPPGHDCSALLDGLLPNQRGDLCSSPALKRDSGISVSAKDLADLIGCRVRDQLLDDELQKLGKFPNFRFLSKLLRDTIPAELTEEDVLEDCLSHLSRKLPDGKKAEDAEIALIEASINLLAHLWATRGRDAESLAQRCPLLARDGSIVHYTAKKIMGPVASWPQQARPFADIYPPSRVLDDVYLSQRAGGINIIQALAEWEIAFPEPLFRGPRREVDVALLRLLVQDNTDATGVTVRDEMFAQVALFSTEVIQRCQEEPELAALLLGFVLNYLAPTDASWRHHRTVIGKRGGQRSPHQVTRCLVACRIKARGMGADAGRSGQREARSVSRNSCISSTW